MKSLAEEVKEKIDLEKKHLAYKGAILKGLDTKKLVEMIPDLEKTYETALREEAAFKNLGAGYLSSGTSDCAEVKKIIAELIINEPVGPSGKKMTTVERDAWLIQERTKNKDLSAAINRQGTVSFGLENNKITVEMAKKRLENIHRVLSLKTAQIQFLTEA